MRYISWTEESEAIQYLELAAEIARSSSCDRSHCGSLIISDNKIIGQGFNSPPWQLESQKRCACAKNSYNKKVTDKTCCIHAEQRAIMDALQHHPDTLVWSRLYFIRLDETGNISFAGKPYCTICSKMSLDVGISEFVLWHEQGIAIYDTEEYNNLSFWYDE
jgi:deoxycytidylate deaminase